MWQKLKDQIPAIILTALILIGAFFFFYQKGIKEVTDRQQTELTSMREQHTAELKATSEDLRRQVDAVNQLLKDAISKRSADVFMTQEEVDKLNTQKVEQLAEAIAKKVNPNGQIARTPEEAERLQNEQVDKVGNRLADRISPILADMAKGQNLTREQIDAYSIKISEQISGVLTSEMARNQELNNQVMVSQTIAQDSMKLSHELTALYLSSFKDQSLITRILTLPANVVRDAAHLSIVDSTERKKMEERLVSEMNELQKRLDGAQAAMPKK